MKEIIKEVSKKVIEAHQWDIGHYGVHHEHTMARHCKGCIESAITKTIEFIENENMTKTKSIIKDIIKIAEKVKLKDIKDLKKLKSKNGKKQKTKLD